MYRSTLAFLMVMLSPWLYIMLTNWEDPHNGSLMAFELAFALVSGGIGVLWHLLSKGARPLTLFPRNDCSPFSRSKAGGQLSRHIEFGEFADNLEALLILLRCLSRGEVVESYSQLIRLREHILQRGDPKSVAWLMPAIDGALGKRR
jgi:hypothetical protein